MGWWDVDYENFISDPIRKYPFHMRGLVRSAHVRPGQVREKIISGR